MWIITINKMLVYICVFIILVVFAMSVHTTQGQFLCTANRGIGLLQEDNPILFNVNGFYSSPASS